MLGQVYGIRERKGKPKGKARTTSCRHHRRRTLLPVPRTKSNPRCFGLDTKPHQLRCTGHCHSSTIHDGTEPHPVADRNPPEFSLRVPASAAAQAPFTMYSTSAYDSIRSCTISSLREIDSSSDHFRIRVKIQNRTQSTSPAAMIDSGATALFLDHPFVKKHRITTFPLRNPINLLNIDGSPNTGGSITHFSRLKLTTGPHEAWTDFLVADLGGEDVILGLPWLRQVNPLIDWTTGMVRIKPRASMEEEPENPATTNFLQQTAGNHLLEEISATLPEPNPTPTPDAPTVPETTLPKPTPQAQNPTPDPELTTDESNQAVC